LQIRRNRLAPFARLTLNDADKLVHLTAEVWQIAVGQLSLFLAEQTLDFVPVALKNLLVSRRVTISWSNYSLSS
jgi:hypothetical protein